MSFLEELARQQRMHVAGRLAAFCLVSHVTQQQVKSVQVGQPVLHTEHIQEHLLAVRHPQVAEQEPRQAPHQVRAARIRGRGHVCHAAAPTTIGNRKPTGVPHQVVHIEESWWMWQPATSHKHQQQISEESTDCQHNQTQTGQAGEEAGRWGASTTAAAAASTAQTDAGLVCVVVACLLAVLTRSAAANPNKL